MTELLVADDADGVAAMAAARIERRFAELDGLSSLVLAGGSTPQRLHRLLSARPIPWWRIVVLLGDERCVPSDHRDSNYGAARAALLGGVAPAAVLRVPTEAPDPETAARLYGQLVAGLPSPVLALLGMGDDGHTASIFPGRSVPEDRDVVAVAAPAPGLHDRVTVTERFLERCDTVMVLVAGAAKATRLAEVLSGGDLPLARVLRRRSGRPTTVIADAEAAGRIGARGDDEGTR